MNKILYTLFITLFILGVSFSQGASALEFYLEEDIEITQIQDDDVVIAGGSVTIEQELKHDAIIASGDIAIEAAIGQDFNFAAGNVEIDAPIGDDVRGLAGSVVIDSDVAGDVILATGDLRIKKGVTIAGDLIVAAGKANIEGDVLGKLKFAGEQLKLNGNIGGDATIYVESFKTSSGSIGGNLTYESGQEILELESMTKGVVEFEKNDFHEHVQNDIKDALFGYTFMKIGFIFIFSTVLFFLLQKFYKKAGNILTKQTGRSFLYGILTFILTPILILLCFISVIAIPIGFLLLFWFILLIMFLEVINVTVLTTLLVAKFPKLDNTYMKIGIILLLSILMGLLNGIDLIIGFFTVGALMILKKDLFTQFKDMK